MSAIWLAIFGLCCFALAYRFYSRFIADKLFGLDDSRQTPAHAQADGVDYVATDRHVLFGHHFTSIAGAAPILGPAIAVIWGWVPALLWVVFGTVFIGAVHDFGCLFVSTRNGGKTVADLTGKIVGPRARVLFLLLVCFLAWIVIAVFAVVIGSLFADYPGTVLPVNFEIVVALVIGWVIYKLKKKLLVPSLIALGLLYAMVWVGAEYTSGFKMPVLFKPAAAAARGRLISGPVAAPETKATLRVEVALDGGPAHTIQLAPRESGEALAASLQEAVRSLTPAGEVDPQAYRDFSASFAAGKEGGTYTCASGSQSEESRVSIAGEGAQALGFATEAQVAKPAARAFRTGRVKTWVVLLLLYSFLASILPVWLLLQPRDYINSHQLFVGLGAMYLGVLLYQPVVQAPAFNLNPEGAAPWFPFLFVTIACGAISGFHGLVGSGTTSKQVDKESDTRAIGYGSMLGEGSLALMALLACTAGFASEELWHSHYASWGAAGGLGQKLGAFVTGGATFLHEGLSLPLEFAKAMIAVIVISFAATTLDTATRIQRFLFQELAGSYSFLAPMKNRYVASALAAFLPLILVFGGGSKPYWMELWPIFGASNQMLGALCLLVLTFYLIRRGRPARYVAIPCVLLAGITGLAMLLNLRAFYERNAWLLVFLSVTLLALSVWILLEGVLTLKSLKDDPEGAEGAELE